MGRTTYDFGELEAKTAELSTMATDFKSSKEALVAADETARGGWTGEGLDAFDQAAATIENMVAWVGSCTDALRANMEAANKNMHEVDVSNSVTAQG